jgi:muconate cycloisomerase
MRIDELTAFHARIPLRTRVTHASHSREANDTLLVRCRLSEGTVGWGEGIPRSYVTGETIESAFAQLADADLAETLGGRFANLEEGVALCRGIAFPVPGGGYRDCFGNAVRCAVETAILDATTRALDVPFSSVTGCVPEAADIRGERERVRYSFVLTGSTRGKLALRAFLVRVFRFREIKLKVGLDDDVGNLRCVRRAAGRRMDIRLDANEAWHWDELEERVAPLLPLGVSSLEQPVPHAEVEKLAGPRGRLGVPVMLDESLCSIGDAERAVAGGTCDLFNIRLSKCGGLIDSLRIAALAQRAGLGFQLGCQVGETGILSALGRQFATTVTGARYLEGSFDRFLVRERLTHEDLTFGIGGWAPRLAGPGLGVTIDEQAVERVVQRRESWTIGG